MTNRPLLIVADHGGLKAYRVEANPTPRPPRLEPVQALDLTVAHGRYADKVTDQAGRFGARTGAGAPGAAGTAEHTTIDLENSRRAVKGVAAQITTLLEQEKPEIWLLAAPAQMNAALLAELPAAAREHLAENVSADLLKADAKELVAHFQRLQRLVHA